MSGFVLEQAYQRASGRMPPQAFAQKLDGFFGHLQGENWHFEARTKAYLGGEVADLLKRRGVGAVLSHWSWLPALAEQAELAGGGIPSRDGTHIVRLVTPRGKSYEESYAMSHPFDRLVPGMMSRGMLEETAGLCRKFSEAGRRTAVVINNRSGGSAPLIAVRLADLLHREGLG